MPVSSDLFPDGGQSLARATPTPTEGLRFRPARDLAEVTEAWTLVYQGYLRAGLIQPNPWQLHAVPHAIQPRSVVVCGRIQGRTVSTLSAYFDRPGGLGLPLDRVYADELEALRQNGRALLEFGLFADRREFIERSVSALLELMRQACYFGVVHGATDGIIGVHPRHAAFYRRVLGFEPAGPEKRHPLVRGHPVVLLRIRWHEQTREAIVPRGLRYLREHPMAAGAFGDRCSLDQSAISGTTIEQWLTWQASLLGD